MAALKRIKPKKKGMASKRTKPDETPDPQGKAAVKAKKQQETRIERTATDFPIAGIGASAGGLEALEELFDNMPADTGMAFVVVTHQHPGHTSMLPELLRRKTEMDVIEAAEGTRLQANHIYIGPPGGQM